MVNTVTKDQRLQITALKSKGKSHSTIAAPAGIPLTAAKKVSATPRRSPSLTALSNRSTSRVKAHHGAVPIETSDTKYTTLEFKPDPNGPFVNATMTEQYLGLELSYRR